jgi:exopolysaccharide production protein ExoY
MSLLLQAPITRGSIRIDNVTTGTGSSTVLTMPRRSAAKRIVDVVGAVTGLIVLAPLFLIVALLVKVGDPAGPVFYRQNRLGHLGRQIGVLKFRTMRWAYSTGPNRPYQTAQAAFIAMGREDLVAAFELTQKVADDPRVSPLGALLRRTSLDELPQLINVLLGHLSLVGPRPITAPELEKYGVHGDTFLTVKPGVTGLWQVSGRSDTTYDERVRLDLTYIRTWNAMLDLTILFRTVGVVLAQRGAH